VPILIKAVEAAIIGDKYTVPAHHRCRWLSGEEDCDDEKVAQAKWLWEAARGKSYPQMDECDWGQVTQLLAAAGAHPSLEGGRTIKEAVRWCDESISAVYALDALIDANPKNPVITSGEACWEAIDGHQYSAACMLVQCVL
jgi:hypothetical protein